MSVKNEYAIVAANHFNNKFTDQEVIKIPDVEFNSLEEIDRYTAAMTKDEFAMQLSYENSMKNTYSIRILNSNSEPSWRRIIFNKKELIPIIDSIVKKTVCKTKKGKKHFFTTKYITSNDPFFVRNWNEVVDEITNGNAEKINYLFEGSYDLLAYAKVLMNTDPYDYEGINEQLQRLENSFRNYDEFRRYLTNKEKPYNQNKYLANFKIKQVIVKPTVMIKTQPEAIKSFNEDKEEFLDYDEIESMVGGDIDSEPYYYERKIPDGRRRK